MNDTETQQRFICLRAEGWSFARIADELKVSKPTLIKWSRKFQFEIQNHRAINIESLHEKWLSTREARVSALGEQLHKVQAELSKRDLTSLTTHQLFTLEEALRRQIKRETGPIQFSSPASEIPTDEYHDRTGLEPLALSPFKPQMLNLRFSTVSAFNAVLRFQILNLRFPPSPFSFYLSNLKFQILVGFTSQLSALII